MRLLSIDLVSDEKLRYVVPTIATLGHVGACTQIGIYPTQALTPSAVSSLSLSHSFPTTGKFSQTE